MPDHVFTRNPMFLDRSAPSRLDDMVVLSGWAFAQNHEGMREMGITHVANLTPDDDGCADAGFTVLQLPIEDGETPPSELLPVFLGFMMGVEARGGRVLLHCHGGISRTASFAIGWLMFKAGANRDSDLRYLWSRAEDRIGAVRPIIMPHVMLKRAWLAYFDTVTP